MRVRKINSNGFDYTFGNSALDFFVNDPEGVAQNVQTRLLLWLGEWYLNIEDGTPYLESILGKFSKTQADAAIQDRVLTTDNVVSIENYVSSLNADMRSLSVSFDLNTTFGPTQVQISNYVEF